MHGCILTTVGGYGQGIGLMPGSKLHGTSNCIIKDTFFDIDQLLGPPFYFNKFNSQNTSNLTSIIMANFCDLKHPS